MSEERKSVYMLGAEDGLLMGPIMALTVVLLGTSTYHAWLSIPSLIFAVSVPVVAYWRLGKRFREAPTSSFSALWLQGISMFFFGGLVMALVAFAALRWLAPGFMLHQIDTLITIYSGMNDPQATHIAETFKTLKESGNIPSALDVALELLYFAVFTGSILSLIYSWVIRRHGKRPTPPPYTGI